MRQPRKLPKQTRSTQTVEDIMTASVLVLLEGGMGKLNTTRVALRAGVSVGSLYQYFPNRESLLYAVLERHLHRVAEAFETACKTTENQPLAAMAEPTVRAFLRAKFADAAEARALYPVSIELDDWKVVQEARSRAVAALSCMLSTATDRPPADPERVSYITVAALASMAQSFLADGLESNAEMHDHLVTMITAYLNAAR